MQILYHTTGPRFNRIIAVHCFKFETSNELIALIGYSENEILPIGMIVSPTSK